MRNISLIIVAVLGIATVNAQTEYGSYTSDGQAIKASVVKDKGVVYMDLNVKGDHSISFNNSTERAEFIEFITTSFTKFKEWEAVALTNNVKDTKKEIASGRYGSNLAWHYGDWQFTFKAVTMSTGMWVNPEGKVFFYVLIPEQRSHDNQYIESDTQALILDADDVASLKLVLSDEVIEAFLNEANSADDLFK